MFIDIHVHASLYARPSFSGVLALPSPNQLIDLYNALDIERGILLPLVGPEVYLPQSSEEIIEIASKSDGKLIPFCNVDPRALTNSAEAPLGEILRYYRDLGCKGIGEVMPNLPFRDPLVQNLFKHVEDVGFPLIFDISDRIGSVYGLYDEPGLPQLEISLQCFPKLKILGHGCAFWSEMGTLRSPQDKKGYPQYPIDKEGAVPRLLRKYENLFGDLSAGSGFNALSRDVKHAIAFLNEFQDKLFFGTDYCHLNFPTPLAKFLLELRSHGDISETVFQKIARVNAIKLLDI